jgi:hypothetical protein
MERLLDDIAAGPFRDMSPRFGGRDGESAMGVD